MTEDEEDEPDTRIHRVIRALSKLMGAVGAILMIWSIFQLFIYQFCEDEYRYDMCNGYHNQVAEWTLVAYMCLPAMVPWIVLYIRAKQGKPWT